MGEHVCVESAVARVWQRGEEGTVRHSVCQPRSNLQDSRANRAPAAAVTMTMMWIPAAAPSSAIPLFRKHWDRGGQSRDFSGSTYREIFCATEAPQGETSRRRPRFPAAPAGGRRSQHDQRDLREQAPCRAQRALRGDRGMPPSSSPPPRSRSLSCVGCAQLVVCGC
jgi:hypothetical protein